MDGHHGQVGQVVGMLASSSQDDVSNTALIGDCVLRYECHYAVNEKFDMILLFLTGNAYASVTKVDSRFKSKTLCQFSSDRLAINRTWNMVTPGSIE